MHRRSRSHDPCRLACAPIAHGRTQKHTGIVVCSGQGCMCACAHTSVSVLYQQVPDSSRAMSVFSILRCISIISLLIGDLSPLTFHEVILMGVCIVWRCAVIICTWVNSRDPERLLHKGLVEYFP